MLDESDEELQRRCELAGEDQRATLKASDGFSAQQPVAHYNPSDQARRLAAYRDLRAQDEADIEYMVCPFIPHLIAGWVHTDTSGWFPQQIQQRIDYFASRSQTLYTCCDTPSSSCMASRTSRLQGLVAKAKWQLELAKRAEAARKAAEEEHYKRTHCKRIRKLTAVKEVAATPAEPVPTPATEANSATTPESNAACGDPASEESGEPASDEVCLACFTFCPGLCKVYRQKVHDRHQLKVLREDHALAMVHVVNWTPNSEGATVRLQGPTLPTRGGFLAFFESAGTSIVELGHGQSHSPSYQRPSLHAELDALASTVKDVVGRPRNYVGFVNVPEPLSEDTKHVCTSMLNLRNICKLMAYSANSELGLKGMYCGCII